MKNKIAKIISIIILLLSSSYEVYANQYPMIKRVIMRGQELAQKHGYSNSEAEKTAQQELSEAELDQYLEECYLYAKNNPNDEVAQEIAKAHEATIKAKKKLEDSIEQSEIMKEAQRRAAKGQIENRNSLEDIIAQIQKNHNVTKKDAYDMAISNTPEAKTASKQLTNKKINKLLNEIKAERVRNAKNAKKLN